MNASVRTVRLLDRRPGEPLPKPQARVVRGITIEDGVAIPPRSVSHSRVVEALIALQVDQSFVWKNNAAEQRRNVKKMHPERDYTQRKLPDGRYRIWRTK